MNISCSFLIIIVVSVQLDASTGPMVVISKARLRDTGVYKCNIIFGEDASQDVKSTNVTVGGRWLD